MCKTKNTKIKLFIPAGLAAATPPLGPILGQYGINTVQFCKDFNAATENLSFFFTNEFSQNSGLAEFTLVVELFINEDRTYRYAIKKPPVSFLLRLLAEVKLGSPRTVAGKVSRQELCYVALFKFPNLPLTSACRIVSGTARSIGIRVIS